MAPFFETILFYFLTPTQETPSISEYCAQTIECTTSTWTCQHKQKKTLSWETNAHVNGEKICRPHLSQRGSKHFHKCNSSLRSQLRAFPVVNHACKESKHVTCMFNKNITIRRTSHCALLCHKATHCWMLSTKLVAPTHDGTHSSNNMSNDAQNSWANQKMTCGANAFCACFTNRSQKNIAEIKWPNAHEMHDRRAQRELPHANNKKEESI